MSSSAKIRWAILALSAILGIILLFCLPNSGRFYCALSIICGIILYYLAESYLDQLLYGEKTATALKEGRTILKESQILQKRCKKPLSDAIIQQLEPVRAALSEALTKRDIPAIDKNKDALSKLVEKHLGQQRKAPWRETFDPIIIAVLLALLLRSFVIEAFEIPSGSMIPNLLVGDKIFVNKLSYNVMVPIFNKQIFSIGEPQRGDVAVFVYPLEPSENFVKRVVALPGDEVEVTHDFVIINGKQLYRRNIGTAAYWDLNGPAGWYENNYNQFEERNGDKSYTVIQDPFRIREDYSKRTIPSGHIFVMGDNRDNSADSRVWGLVPMENLIGKAMFIWWSKGPNLHTERFFTWVN